jgi:hypothetical protein
VSARVTPKGGVGALSALRSNKFCDHYPRGARITTYYLNASEFVSHKVFHLRTRATSPKHAHYSRGAVQIPLHSWIQCLAGNARRILASGSLRRHCGQNTTHPK